MVVSIPESVIGRDSAQFLGSLVLLQLKAALLRRKGDDVPPFFVYVDEFQKFASVGFEELLAEARKFGVGLVMAHQNLEQLRAFSLMTGLPLDALGELDPRQCRDNGGVSRGTQTLIYWRPK